MKNIFSILIIQLTFVFSAATITDVAGFRMMSCPDYGTSCIDDLLNEIWTQGCGCDCAGIGCDSNEGEMKMIPQF